MASFLGMAAASSYSASTFYSLSLFFLLLCAHALEYNGTTLLSEQREFDYFVLALQWLGTLCRSTQKCCSKNACCRGSEGPAQFTIHGLWPFYNVGGLPQCCTDSNFDAKELSPILDPLQKYWPSLSCTSPSTCHVKKGTFWAHEWEKHGTCASPVIGNEYDYFLTTLNVYFKYNVSKALEDAGYAPSNTEKYPRGGIVSAVQTAFNTTPSISCSKKGALKELRLCFYKNFEPRDCVDGSTIAHGMDVTKKSSCPSYVMLPAYEPKSSKLMDL